MEEQKNHEKISKANPIRPFCLEYTDAKKEVFCTINNSSRKHNVPMFLMESILTEALYQVREAARVEVENANTLFKTQLDELNKQTEEVP